MIPWSVLDAFCATTEPVPLEGGQNTCWRSGDLVLKPTAYPEGCEWIGETLSALSQSGFRIPPQIRAKNGRFVFESWTCAGYLKGFTPKGTHFAERLAASEAFHTAIAGLDKPEYGDRRTDPWATAHAVVFDDRDWTPHPDLNPTLGLLASLRQNINLPNRVVHGDISGNYIFGPDGPPAIIDFTPYWAPAGFGEAVLVADVVVWEKMDFDDIFPKVAHIPEIVQLLVRAAQRRLLEYDCHFQAGAPYTRSITWQPHYQRLAEHIAART